MKSEELMIYDWVYYFGQPTRILQISAACAYKHINFIPLTEEILEKNFPKKDDEADYVKERINVGFSVDWFPISDLDGAFFIILDMPYKLNMARIEHIHKHIHKGVFRYVHELQHLLRLCRIDKEIVL